MKIIFYITIVSLLITNYSIGQKSAILEYNKEYAEEFREYVNDNMYNLFDSSQIENNTLYIDNDLFELNKYQLMSEFVYDNRAILEAELDTIIIELTSSKAGVDIHIIYDEAEEDGIVDNIADIFNQHRDTAANMIQALNAIDIDNNADLNVLQKIDLNLLIADGINNAYNNDYAQGISPLFPNLTIYDDDAIDFDEEPIEIDLNKPYQVAWCEARPNPDGSNLDITVVVVGTFSEKEIQGGGSTHLGSYIDPSRGCTQGMSYYDGERFRGALFIEVLGGNWPASSCLGFNRGSVADQILSTILIQLSAEALNIMKTDYGIYAH
jgi:hypothetical protein